MSTDAGRLTVSYLVRCALAAADSLVKQDQNGVSYTYSGEIGLAPQYKTGACDANCQEMISSCMLAHVNTTGTHIPLWMVAPMTPIGWSQSPWYPTREGTFFGNIFQPDSSGLVRAHYCTAATVMNNAVPGRLGANQTGAPYTDPYASPGYCDSSCKMTGANGKIDGASSCPADGYTWNNPITVWRGQVFQAETATIKGGSVVTCTNCSAGKRLSKITSATTISGIYSSDTATHTAVVYYTNGDTVSHYMQINAIADSTSGQTVKKMTGGSALFPPTGSWDQVGSVTIFASGFVQAPRPRSADAHQRRRAGSGLRRGCPVRTTDIIQVN